LRWDYGERGGEGLIRGSQKGEARRGGGGAGGPVGKVTVPLIDLKGVAQWGGKGRGNLGKERNESGEGTKNTCY